MRIAFLLLASVLLVLSPGCVSTAPPLSPEEVARIDCGPYPEQYESAVRAYFARTVTDPNSIKLRLGQPYKGYLQQGPLMGGKVQEAGYFVDVWLQASHAAGAASGEHHLAVLIKNNAVLFELRQEDFPNIKRVP